MRKVQHVEENVKVSDGRKLSQKMLFELRKHRWVIDESVKKERLEKLFDQFA